VIQGLITGQGHAGRVELALKSCAVLQRFCYLLLQQRLLVYIKLPFLHRAAEAGLRPC
jgi:hypothetical protein